MEKLNGNNCLRPVPREHVNAVWPQVAGMIDKAMWHSQGELTTDQLHLLCNQGHAHLFVVTKGDTVTGVVAIELIIYPQFTVANFIVTSGRMFVDADLYEQAKQACKALGAQKIQGYCRDSVARLWQRLGMKQIYKVVRDDI